MAVWLHSTDWSVAKCTSGSEVAAPTPVTSPVEVAGAIASSARERSSLVNALGVVLGLNDDAIHDQNDIVTHLRAGLWLYKVNGVLARGTAISTNVKSRDIVHSMSPETFCVLGRWCLMRLIG